MVVVEEGGLKEQAMRDTRLEKFNCLRIFVHSPRHLKRSCDLKLVQLTTKSLVVW